MLVEFSLDSSARALPVDAREGVSSLGSGQPVKNQLLVMLTLSARI